MKRLSTLVFVIALTTGAFAQGFWAPGACWTFDDLSGLNAERYQYVGDSVIDGMDVQVCLWEMCNISPPGVYNCDNMNGPYYEFVTTQGEAVLSWVYPFSTVWDTLYWLGEPGDRWWPNGSEPFCLGYSGMLEIQDTGHIVIQGIQLRTWDVIRLNEFGTPLPSLPVTITERIGAAPRNFCPSICSAIVDCYFYQLVHYSDGEINIPSGTSCGIAMSSGIHSAVDEVELLPNPGTDQLRITGFTASASVEVRDPLGRLVHSQPPHLMTAPIETWSWSTGTYFLTVTDASGAQQVLRWVKQ